MWNLQPLPADILAFYKNVPLTFLHNIPEYVKQA